MQVWLVLVLVLPCHEAPITRNLLWTHCWIVGGGQTTNRPNIEHGGKGTYDKRGNPNRTLEVVQPW
jgi:hypothetical protein